MNRDVYAKRKVMKDIDVNKSPEYKHWRKVYELYYSDSLVPVTFIYDVAWSEIAYKRLTQAEKVKEEVDEYKT